MLGDDGETTNGEHPGVSDMIRYGISLGRAARPSSDSPNLFSMDGGAESPLAPDVLESKRWRSLSDQVHTAGGLLLLAAPSQIPYLNALLAQLDGVLLVGEAAPNTPARVLGEVRTAATMRTPALQARAIPQPATSGGSWRWISAAVVGIAALLAVPQVREPLMRMAGLEGAPSVAAPAASQTLDALPPTPPPVTSDAAWSTELRFLNSRVDAQSAIAALVDSFPAATFAEVRTAADSTTWYRVLLGAFADSLSAETFLSSLRTRGTVPGLSGSVTHVPFALLVDSASDNALARVRVAALQGRGQPAYALRDALNVWHVYVGAFAESGDAARLKLQLDSLNIQSALVIRAGSTS